MVLCVCTIVESGREMEMCGHAHSRGLVPPQARSMLHGSVVPRRACVNVEVSCKALARAFGAATASWHVRLRCAEAGTLRRRRRQHALWDDRQSLGRSAPGIGSQVPTHSRACRSCFLLPLQCRFQLDCCQAELGRVHPPDAFVFFLTSHPRFDPRARAHLDMERPPDRAESWRASDYAWDANALIASPKEAFGDELACQVLTSKVACFRLQDARRS